MHRELNDLSNSVGDPYYIESGYGAAYGADNVMYEPDWVYPEGCPNCSPGMDYGTGMGYEPGMGYDQWGGGYCPPGYPGEGVMPSRWEELLRLARETNKCCRRMMEMMQSMHQQNRNALTEK